MHLLIKNARGQLVFSSIPKELEHYCEDCTVENETFVFEGKKYRHGRMEFDDGAVYAITPELHTVNRPRYFKERLRASQMLLPIIGNIETQAVTKATAHTRRLIHNLESLNGHSMQELYNIVSEEELRETSPEKRKGLIEEKLKAHRDNAHKTILNLIKNNASMKMEFSVFNKLLRGKTGKTEKQPHPLKRALLNVAHIFFQDFTDKSVLLSFAESDVFVWVDYESFQVTFYQLFDNAVKYTLPDTDLSIEFEKKDGTIDVILRMLSVKIDEDEVEKIMQDRYCGRNAKKLGVNGKGIGMFNIERTLALNNGRLSIHTNIGGNTVNKDGVPYERNEFIVTLPIYNK